MGLCNSWQTASVKRSRRGYCNVLAIEFQLVFPDVSPRTTPGAIKPYQNNKLGLKQFKATYNTAIFLDYCLLPKATCIIVSRVDHHMHEGWTLACSTKTYALCLTSDCDLAYGVAIIFSVLFEIICSITEMCKYNVNSLTAVFKH